MKKVNINKVTNDLIQKGKFYTVNLNAGEVIRLQKELRDQDIVTRFVNSDYGPYLEYKECKKVRSK